MSTHSKYVLINPVSILTIFTYPSWAEIHFAAHCHLLSSSETYSWWMIDRCDWKASNMSWVALLLSHWSHHICRESHNYTPYSACRLSDAPPTNGIYWRNNLQFNLLVYILPKGLNGHDQITQLFSCMLFCHPAYWNIISTYLSLSNNDSPFFPHIIWIDTWEAWR